MMAVKKKRKASARSAGVDYKAMYDDLYQQVKEANAAKKKLLTTISKNVDKLSGVICEPDPPGCSGPSRPKSSFESLCLSIQGANADKLARLTKISSDIERLLGNICEPDPPGC